MRNQNERETEDLTIALLKQEKARVDEEIEKFQQYLDAHKDMEDVRVAVVRRKPGQTYYYVEKPGDTGRHSVRPDEADTVRIVLNRRYSVRCKKDAEAKVHCLERCISMIQKHYDSPRRPAMPENCRTSAALLARLDDGYGSPGQEEWGKASSARFASQRPYWPEGRKYRCSSGLYVRSKSEMLIVETLLRRGIPFYYELERTIGGKVLHPDFTLYSVPLSREIIWEHFGMMDDREYRTRAADKLRAYWENGWRFCQNLIATYEDEENELDLRQVNALLDSYF